MEEIWNNLTLSLVERLEQLFKARIFPHFEKFFRTGIKLTFSEAEAAELLHIEKSTLAEIRKAKEINYYQFGKSPVYGLQHIQDYLTRHEVENIPKIYTLKTEISFLGAELTKR